MRPCDSVHENARTHIADVDRKKTDLTGLRQELVKLSDSWGGGSVADCRILEGLSGFPCVGGHSG